MTKTLLKPVLVLVGLIAGPTPAAPRIAIPAFELNDITSLPNTPQEKQRTASMAPLLIAALSHDGAYLGERVADAALTSANAGFGYLFHHPDLAADLGKAQGADWIVIAQHSKPSFLVSYLWAYLVDTRNRQILARYDIELKGNHSSVTEHAIAALARKIKQSLAGPSSAPVSFSATR
ncbi:DUF2380 domain-containing protein [Methylomonas sp. LWB]|uniref:DUF2380 domain-containing protein n=1 Tax=Methylomonas sp. LWB TaxID=1905845 RepID=UPI0008D97351|nr:DUF2380 domain-containing protein [Methylomonas sp. LWB]OHX36842.1 DUF2380 domain-containing protein [Methylomonas sp. LWB]